MKKYRVTEINTVSHVYEVEARDQREAEQRVLDGKAERLPEYDSHVDRVFDFEEIKDE